MPDVDTTHSSINQGVDRKTLKIIKKRFLQVNKARLARTKSALNSRHQIFLDALPMMFHVNHPMLPGYVSHQTPAGLTAYKPTKVDIANTQRLARSFNYHREPSAKGDIHGLYLMGSCGTVAQSGSSDLDVWVCHPSTLSIDETLLLRQKCDEISRWANTIGLEAHFFLMEDEKFRKGERKSLTTEDCGSSQHYLLLDEFYRTGLLIAGRVPIWWLIPPEEEEHYEYYAETLRSKQFVRKDDTVDFGSVAHIPAGEFIGAGVWQLYKAIDSPYKSVLKILLTEVYAAEYPDVEPLSNQFKQSIYNNQLDIDELDPYVVVYRKLEQYLLNRKEFKRLDLIRRCFYFKVGKSLSRPSTNKSKSWQRQLMEKLVNEWQWPTEQLINLDRHNHWKAPQVIAEQKLLVKELTNSYRFVLEFARRTGAAAIINSQEMTVLGRKLYAAFEHKAGKIEWINPGIANNLIEDNLTFYQYRNSSNKLSWAVSAEEINTQNIANNKPLKKADELTSLLAWCHFNSLLDNSTRLAVVKGEHNVNEVELRNMFRSMRHKLPVAKQYDSDDDQKHIRFHQPMRPTQLQFFINVGVDPLENFRTQGIERLSAQTDSLGFSGLRENLVLNVEQILVNSWGEVNSRRYDGEQALIRCLNDYLKMLPPNSNMALPKLEVQCFSPARAKAIAMRVEELFRDIAACYYSGTRPANSRYILEIQREFFVLQFIDNQARIEHASNEAELIHYLEKNQTSYSPIILDRYCLKNSILESIVQCAVAEQIQIFFLQKNKQADVYILDERGSLFYYHCPFHDEQTLLSPLDQFIQSMLFRRSSEDKHSVNSTTDLDTNTFDLSHYEVKYYEIIETANGVQLTRRNIINETSGGNFFNIQAIADQDDNEKMHFTIYCDQHEFSEQELGKDLFHQVAKFIINRRKSNQSYPCYITDLDLSRAGNDTVSLPAQTVQYLQHKRTLELALNNALNDL